MPGASMINWLTPEVDASVPELDVERALARLVRGRRDLDRHRRPRGDHPVEAAPKEWTRNRH